MTPTLAGSSARALGAYYTPPVAAQVLVSWALREQGDRILEPSMGDGAFLHAVAAESRRRQLRPEVFGVELAADTFEATVASGAVSRSNAIRDDFLAVKPFDVDAVVGNPPYVRLRHLPPEQDRRAQGVGQHVLGSPIDPAGSVWMPFVLHATRFLRPGGRLAFVLPYDLTYVRYARPLWTFLGRHFADLRVVRVHERMFPDIMQEAVLLLAGGYGGATSEIEFDAYETVARLANRRPTSSGRIAIADVVRGDRAFLEALLSDDARNLLRSRLDGLTVPASSAVTFNIGYVCGDKRFFHPDTATVTKYALPETSLRPALTSSRQLRGVGLRTSGVGAAGSRLFLPPADATALTPGERRYVALGKKAGVADRYKCRVRDPWYVTPYVKVPDVVLPVFTERPALLVNDAGLVASNSLLCGYVKDTSPDDLAAAWFTSLTVLQLELQVHALGGGVMVLVPREAGAVRLPKGARASADHLARLQALLSEDKVGHAFTAGDEPVLREQVGLSSNEVALIEEAADTLTHWRQPVRGLREDVHEEQPALEGVGHPVDERGDVEVAAGH